jgi:hypothetical protein
MAGIDLTAAEKVLFVAGLPSDASDGPMWLLAQLNSISVYIENASLKIREGIYADETVLKNR